MIGHRGHPDRRYNDWHYTCPEHWKYIDIDGMAVCDICGDPLFLVESTSNPEKSTRYAVALGRRAGLPVVLILLPKVAPAHTCQGCGERHLPPIASDAEVTWRFQPMVEHPAKRGTLAEWREVEAGIRADHDRATGCGATRSSRSTTAATRR